VFTQQYTEFLEFDCNRVMVRAYNSERVKKYEFQGVKGLPNDQYIVFVIAYFRIYGDAKMYQFFREV
jgi:hypothetical protein